MAFGGYGGVRAGNGDQEEMPGSLLQGNREKVERPSIAPTGGRVETTEPVLPGMAVQAGEIPASRSQINASGDFGGAGGDRSRVREPTSLS